MTEDLREYAFAWTRGGPFYELLRRARLIDHRGFVRWHAVVAIVWLPFVAIVPYRVIMGEEIEPVIRDPSAHVRLLLSIPLLLVAHHALEARTKAAMVALRHEQVAHRDVLEKLVAQSERLRTSPFVEGVLAIIALSGGQVVLWGEHGPAGFVYGVHHEGSITFATFWYATIALPFVQFLSLRWLWRWAIWTYVVIRLSRAELALNALHPDQAAGLKMIGNPIDAFSLFVTANMVVVSAAWIAKVQGHEATLQELVPRFIAFMLLVMVLTCGPLLLFAGQMYRARHQDVTRYHAFAHDYVAAFRRKWITGDATVGRTDESPLGTPDLQSLNDLDGSFEKSDGTRAVPFGKRTLITLWLSGLLPMVPFIFATEPLPDIAKQLGRMLQLPGF